MLFKLRPQIWLAALILLAGCGRVNEERTATLDAGAYSIISIDPPKMEQNVSLTVASNGVPIDVYIVLEGDENAALKLAESTLRSNKPMLGALGSLQKITSGTLNVVVPPKKGYSVLLLNPSNKRTDVKLKISGR